MTTDEKFDAIFKRTGDLSQDDKSWIKGEFESRMDLFFDNKKMFWERIKDAPQDAFNHIVQAQIADLYEKISLKDEDSSIVMDLFFSFVLGPLVAQVLSSMFNKVVGSQFFARLFTEKVNVSSGAIEVIDLTILNLEKLDEGTAMKLFNQNFGKMLNNGNPDQETKNKFIEFGKDALKDGGRDVPSILSKVTKQSPSTKASSEINIATAVKKAVAYSQHQLDFFMDLSRGLKRWLNNIVYENDSTLKQTLKIFKWILDKSNDYLIDNTPAAMDKAKDDYALLMEALYWSMIYKGKIFTFKVVPSLAGKRSLKPVIETAGSEFLKINNNNPSYAPYPVEVLVGEPVLKRLLEAFPHNQERKFEDDIRSGVKEEVVYAKMDTYFQTLYFQIVHRNILAKVAEVVQKAASFTSSIINTTSKGLF